MAPVSRERQRKEDGGHVLSRESLVQGHFELRPRLHATRALICAQYFSPPTLAEDCVLLADRIWTKAQDATVVLAASLCGHMMGPPVASRLTTLANRPIRFVSASFQDVGYPKFTPGFALGPGDKAVVVFENAMRGERIRPVLRLITDVGATATLVAVLLDRRSPGVDFGLPFLAFLDASDYTHDLEADQPCPACDGGTELALIKVI